MKKVMSPATLDKLVKSGQVRVVKKKPAPDPAAPIVKRLDQVVVAMNQVTVVLHKLAAARPPARPPAPAAPPVAVKVPPRPRKWKFTIDRNLRTGQITTITARAED